MASAMASFETVEEDLPFLFPPPNQLREGAGAGAAAEAGADVDAAGLKIGGASKSTSSSLEFDWLIV